MRPSVSVRSFLVVTLLLSAPLLVVYSQVELQVGYAILTVDPGSPTPAASALFSATNAQGILVWEAGVAATEPVSRGRVFVDQTSGTRTAIALANPSNEPVMVMLTLRDSLGSEFARQTEDFAAREHKPLFVDELFSIADGFQGSLTFEAGAGQLGAVTLRQNTNLQGEAIFATLPVVDLDAEASTESVIFPHIGAGDKLSTQIILINTGAETVMGEIQFFDDDGMPLGLELDDISGTEFTYEIEADGTFKSTLTLGSGLALGSALLTPAEGSQTPSGVALFQFTSSGSVISEAGVGAVRATTEARIFVDQEGTRTGVAIASATNQATTVVFDLLDGSGNSLETTSEMVADRGHRAVFVDELFPGLAEGFTGLMAISSSEAIVPVTLKLTTNALNQPILTTLPVADLTLQSTARNLIFPQIGFGDSGGGEFATRLILINGDKALPAGGGLQFFESSGALMTLPLGGEIGSDFTYQIPSGGGQELRPGVVVAEIAQIIVDLESPNASEVAVNEGNTLQLNPLVLDTEGRVVTDVSLSYSSLDQDIATVDAFGRIEGELRGFSTLTVSAGEIVTTATITVVGLESSSDQGFEAIVQDRAGRVYLANTREHTILLAQDLQSDPELYAGVENSAGLVDDERLETLFSNPGSLVLNQAKGTLYVSDTSNHVIRIVHPGPDGQVETLAGSGQAGSIDGAGSEAQFNNPGGIALDSRGNLWVADSGNHAIRRINVVTREVATIAGLPGEAGLADGRGQEARFSSPMGIAVESQPARQLLGQTVQEGPPPEVRVIVADTGNSTLRWVTASGVVETVGTVSQSSFNDGSRPLATTPAIFDSPTGVTVDPFENIYVTEQSKGRVRILLKTGEIVEAAQSNTFVEPRGIIISASGRGLVADRSASARRIVYGNPQITDITPSRMREGGGETVIIRGRNFGLDSIVIAAGLIIADSRVQDTETITFVAPKLPIGRTTITVQNRAGLAQTPVFTEPVPLSELSVGHINTIAGGSPLLNDNGRLATEAGVSLPGGVTVDSAGNLFIADSGKNRILKVDAMTKIITTVAGGADGSLIGDGGQATEATLNFPQGITVDGAGNLYIAERSRNRVRKVDGETGIITTVVSRLNSPRSVTVDDAGNLFIGDRNSNRVLRVDSESGMMTTVAGNGMRGFSGDGGAATAAALNIPRGLAVDGAGNLFVGDSGNNRVRKVDGKTGIITTVAGGGSGGDGEPATSAALSFPNGVTVDGAGNLFISDDGSNRIRKVDSGTGIITTVAGNGSPDFSGDGGPATAASVDSHGVTLDGAGNLFVRDRINNRIRKVDGISGIITTVAGTGESRASDNGGPATAAYLSSPRRVVVDGAGNLFIAETNSIAKVDGATGIITLAAGGSSDFGFDFSGDGGPATAAGFGFTSGVTVDGAGNLFIADSGNNRIRRVDGVTGIITTVAGSGPTGTTNFGAFSGDGGPATAARMATPEAVTVDGAGSLFIADTGNNRIRKVDGTTGIITTVAGGGAGGDGGAATAAVLNSPQGITVDGAGNLFIADTNNSRIRKVDGAGTITTVAGTGNFGFSGDGGPATAAALDRPGGVAVDGAGNLFIADTRDFRIRRVDAVTRIITTVAGTGDFGFSGDGGPALAALLSRPQGVTVDGAGNLFIADTTDGRIRAVRGPIP